MNPPPPPLSPLTPAAGASLSHGPGDVGLVMGGGGARAAYQVGFLRFLASRFPELHIPYIHGVSAGAINAALLASHHGTFLQAVDELSHLWSGLTIDHVFRVDPSSLAMNSVRWLRQLGGGGLRGGRIHVRGLVDTSPLRTHLAETLHCPGLRPAGVTASGGRGRGGRTDHKSSPAAWLIHW